MILANNIPQGATHVASNGVYYKKTGNFWFSYVMGGWYTVSGTPSLELKELSIER